MAFSRELPEHARLLGSQELTGPHGHGQSGEGAQPVCSLAFA